MEELVNIVAQKTGLSEDKARAAVDTVIDHLKSKFPQLSAEHLESTAGEGRSGSLSEKLGGLLGKKSA
jgi:hypothetical protein